MTAVEIRQVGFRYPDADAAALHAVSCAITSGTFVVLAGPSGGGKSTLLRTVNGLVPHTSGGAYAGEVVVGGRSTRTHRPRDLADVVGFVHQDPEAHFVVDHVEYDIAFVLENLGVDPTAMRRRVEEVLDALGVAHLRDRSPATLSGGERQRCAIAAAMAAAPGVLILDEPTSQLDPQGADDVFAALARLNADLGTTVVLAEHRLDRAAPLADRAVRIDGGRLIADGAPGPVLADYEGAPAVTRLGRLLGWDPPPLTVKDARRAAVGDPVAQQAAAQAAANPPAVPVAGEVLLSADGIGAVRGGREVLSGVGLDVCQGEVVALLGRNGAGKTTLLRLLAGLDAPAAGRVQARTRVAYVPQDPNLLLTEPTVRAELETTLRLLRRDDPNAIAHWLAALRLDALAGRDPRTLSGGERQRVAVAAVAVGGAEVLLLDEPTRGMDAPSRCALADAAQRHAADGGAVVLATHDVELAAQVATRAVVLGDGDVVAAGPARDVLSGSLFAPQVLRVLAPLLTVGEVAAALGAAGPAGPAGGAEAPA